jgi:hypothetical protein
MGFAAPRRHISPEFLINNRAGQSFCEHLPGGQAAGEFEAPHQLVHRKCIWQGGDR